MPTKSSLLCDRISAISLSLGVFLSIIAFLPGGFVDSGVLKGYIIIFAVSIGLISWLLGRLIEGSFHIPSSKIIVALGFSVFVLLLSTIFAHSINISFFGEKFEQGSFVVLSSLMIMTFLVGIVFNTPKRIIIFLETFFAVYIVLAVFQFIHLFFPQLTSFGVLFNKVDTPIGSWSDFAFISGAVLIGLTLMLSFVKLPRNLKIISFIGSIISLFFVIICNIIGVWILVWFSSIIILIYFLEIERKSTERKFPFLVFVISLIALLFILANNLIGGVLVGYLKTSYSDVHPGFLATMHVAGESLKLHPILGSGPNNFANEWLINRPSSVNSSVFWDTSFISGSGFLVTVGILGGVLGILSILFFIISFFYEGIKKVFIIKADKKNQSIIFCLFLIAMYFVLGITIYPPGISVIELAFFFIGLFIALLVNEDLIPKINLNFLKDQRTSFFAILAIVVLLMASAAITYCATTRFTSIMFFQKVIINEKNGNLDSANNNLTKAVSLSDLQTFEKTQTQLAEQSIQKILSMSSDATPIDVIKTNLQSAIDTGNSSALNAISIDKTNPENYLAFGDFLRTIIPLKVDGADKRAIDAYNKAISLAPNYPKSYLSLASLYFDIGDNTNAEIYTKKAIALKPNYTEAFFLMSQIEVANGNIDSAIKGLQDTLRFGANNPDIYFEIGILKYQNGDYLSAINAFKSAININNQYFNAWYYLALADQKLENNQEAITILTALHSRFPDNKNISDALDSLNNPVPDKKSENKSKSVSNLKTEKVKKLPVSTDTVNNSSN